MMTTALVVENHPLYRQGLSDLLRTTLDRPKVIGANSVEAVFHSAASKLAVKLIVLDSVLPGLSGAGAIRALLDRYGHAALVAVSASEDRRDAAAALRAGARAFVSKSVSNEVLGDTVLRVLTGRLTKPEWITPEGVREVLEYPGPELTQRQRQVLALIRRGYTNKEIGLHLKRLTGQV